MYSSLRIIIFNMDINLRSMDEETVLRHSAVNGRHPPGEWTGSNRFQRGRAGLIRQVARLIASGGVSLFRYLMTNGLFGGPGVVILSRHDRATFGTVDMRRATTLITLRRLNMVKHLEIFLSSLSRILPPGTNFVGCFSPAKKDSTVTERPGREYSFPGWLFHFSRVECHSLNRRKVSDMLERNGLRLVNMKESNGVTYFHSRKIPGFPVMTA